MTNNINPLAVVDEEFDFDREFDRASLFERWLYRYTLSCFDALTDRVQRVEEHLGDVRSLTIRDLDDVDHSFADVVELLGYIDRRIDALEERRP